MGWLAGCNDAGCCDVACDANGLCLPSCLHMHMQYWSTFFSNPLNYNSDRFPNMAFYPRVRLFDQVNFDTPDQCEAGACSLCVCDLPAGHVL